jgi:mono/diheme cytochrome c family protein
VHWLDRRVLDLLGIDVPIIQAPMAGVTTMEMSNMVWNRRENGKGWNVRLLVIGVVAIGDLVVGAARAQDAQLARGKYLVTLGGCTDCHTPGHLLGKPDVARFLGGSDVGFAVPGLGIFVGRNLTPDKETGLGLWTRDQIATAVTTGVRPDGRVLAPVMPWAAYAQLTKTDALAIAAYLQSLPTVKREVPGPFGPNEKVSVFVMDVLPADVHNTLLQHPTGSHPPAK